MGNKQGVKNKQRVSLELVKRLCKKLSNKVCVNDLKAKDERWVGVGPSTKWDNKAVKVLRQELKAGKGDLVAEIWTKDNKKGIEQENIMGIRRENKLGIGPDNKADKR